MILLMFTDYKSIIIIIIVIIIAGHQLTPGPICAGVMRTVYIVLRYLLSSLINDDE